MTKVAIIGSHGLYANYGGWDQLVKNLAERKSNSDLEYLIFNAKESQKNIKPPAGVKVKYINLKASGFEGIFYDFWTIFICYFKVDVLLLLGVQGIPLIAFLSIFKKKIILSNVGGLEWERPKFGKLAKWYLKFCFRLSFKFSKHVILDNQHYLTFVPNNYLSKSVIIPYGGEIDKSLIINSELLEKYPFLNRSYFLSISRALEDNCIRELCETFSETNSELVLISNFSSSEYGKSILEKFSNVPNILLINGLYLKAELDLVRRNAKAYIHTHTLCGTAPSLVEMIICQIPIISVDVPQNRFTLDNQGLYYKSFQDLLKLIKTERDFSQYVPEAEICLQYDWDLIVKKYEQLYK
jgi:glycosyltransferase involved in cell wall biosynthesis